MITAKVFKSGNSQAIRIPNEFRTEQKEFYICEYGECLYLVPTSDPWSLVRSSLGKAAQEPTIKREQPMLAELPKREDF